MRFTTQEYTEMIICYGMAGKNFREAARIYAEQFPGRDRYPTKDTIARCVQRARDTGSLLPWGRHTCGAPPRLTVNDEERILRVFEENPRNSVRRVARALGYTQYAVHRTLRRNSLHPYHFQRVQQLLARDQEERIYFCEGILTIFIEHTHICDVFTYHTNDWKNARRIPCTMSAEFIIP